VLEYTTSAAFTRYPNPGIFQWRVKEKLKSRLAIKVARRFVVLVFGGLGNRN